MGSLHHFLPYEATKRHSIQSATRTGTSAEPTMLAHCFWSSSFQTCEKYLSICKLSSLCYFIIAAGTGQNRNWYPEVRHYFSRYIKRWLWNWMMDKDQNYLDSFIKHITVTRVVFRCLCLVLLFRSKLLTFSIYMMKGLII